MKTSNIYSEGISGIEVRLNLMDMYAINHLLDRWAHYISSLNLHRAWSEKRSNSDYWGMNKEQRDAWLKENPEPQYSEPNFFEEVKPVMNFLLKLALPEGEKATVFDEILNEEPVAE